MESQETIDRLSILEEVEGARDLGMISSELTDTIQTLVRGELTSGIALLNVPLISDKINLLVTMKLKYPTTDLYASLVANAVAEIEAAIAPPA